MLRESVPRHKRATLFERSMCHPKVRSAFLALAGLTCASSSVIAVEKANTPEVCPAVPKASQLAIQEALAEEPLPLTVAQNQQLAESINTSLLTGEKNNRVQNEIYTATSSKEVFASLNNFTKQNYGFETKIAKKNEPINDHLTFSSIKPEDISASQLEITIKDNAVHYVDTLANMPTELVTVSGLEKVVLIKDLKFKRPDTNDENFDPRGFASDRTIFLESSSLPVFSHEVAHLLDERFCGSDGTENDPIFQSTNPAKYEKEKHELWRSGYYDKSEVEKRKLDKIIHQFTTEYYGTRNIEEDKAVIAEELFEGDLCGSETVQKKKQLLLERWETLAPGSGKIYAAKGEK